MEQSISDLNFSKTFIIVSDLEKILASNKIIFI